MTSRPTTITTAATKDNNDWFPVNWGLAVLATLILIKERLFSSSSFFSKAIYETISESQMEVEQG